MKKAAALNPPAPAAASAATAATEIATIRIELVGTEPLIWREVEAPTSITLKTLHDVIQAVMLWADYHLWEFRIDGVAYGLPIKDDWRETPLRDAAKIRLRDLLRPRKTTIDYLYDFGDDWELRLTVTRPRAGELGVLYPRYVAGERNSPPEDCGGLPGFYDLLDARDDEDHERHEEADDWLDDYDAATIDIEPIYFALLRIARRGGVAKRRAGKAAAKG